MLWYGLDVCASLCRQTTWFTAKTAHMPLVQATLARARLRAASAATDSGLQAAVAASEAGSSYSTGGSGEAPSAAVEQTAVPPRK